jgi:hypothetical protein
MQVPITTGIHRINSTSSWDHHVGICSDDFLFFFLLSLPFPAASVSDGFEGYDGKRMGKKSPGQDLVSWNFALLLQLMLCLQTHFSFFRLHHQPS